MRHTADDSEWNDHLFTYLKKSGSLAEVPANLERRVVFPFDVEPPSILLAEKQKASS